MSEAVDLLGWLDLVRIDASRKLDEDRKAELGQFLTPVPVARLMASMLKPSRNEVHVLDPGAGVGTLFTAAVAEFCCREVRPQAIHVTAYEIDPDLAQYVPDAFRFCETECRRAGIRFTGELVKADFLACAADLLSADLFAAPSGARFTCAILNPPYRKINSGSEHRRILRRIGVETSNLYTGFVTATIKLLATGGEMVAITPRSFANGQYFRPFRRLLLQEMALLRLHVFESRQQAFRDDEVLQENLIVHAVKGASRAERVFVSCSSGPDDQMPLSRALDYERVVWPDDPEYFIHITPDDLGEQVAARMAAFEATLPDLGLTVSTGRVVDFRVRPFLRCEAGVETAPLIWPTHFARGQIAWPKEGRKPNAIADVNRIRDQLVSNEPCVRRSTIRNECSRLGICPLLA